VVVAVAAAIVIQREVMEPDGRSIMTWAATRGGALTGLTPERVRGSSVTDRSDGGDLTGPIGFVASDRACTGPTSASGRTISVLMPLRVLGGGILPGGC